MGNQACALRLVIYAAVLASLCACARTPTRTVANVLMLAGGATVVVGLVGATGADLTDDCFSETESSLCAPGQPSPPEPALGLAIAGVGVAIATAGVLTMAMESRSERAERRRPRAGQQHAARPPDEEAPAFEPDDSELEMMSRAAVEARAQEHDSTDACAGLPPSEADRCRAPYVRPEIGIDAFLRE